MNTNIQEFKPLIKPNQLNDILPIDTATQNFVIKSNETKRIKIPVFCGLIILRYCIFATITNFITN